MCTQILSSHAGSQLLPKVHYNEESLLDNLLNDGCTSSCLTTVYTNMQFHTAACIFVYVYIRTYITLCVGISKAIAGKYMLAILPCNHAGQYLDMAQEHCFVH